MSAESLPAELLLLLACSRRRPTAHDTETVTDLAAAGLDWERVVDAAWNHALLPLVQRHLEVADCAVPGTVPEPIRGQMRFLQARNVADMLHRTRELVTIVEALEAAGIPVLPYKGPPLAHRLYGNVSLRQAGDLDLLVSSADFREARRMLGGMGYRPRVPLSPSREALLLRAYCNQVLDGESGVTVELHWRFTNPAMAFDLEFDDLLPRLQRLPLGGANLRALRDEDLLVVLTVHGSKHRWARLEWITGVAEHLRNAPGLDWGRALQQARATGSSRRLFLGLWLAHELAAAPIPEAVLDQLRSDRAVARLTADVRRGLVHAHDAVSESGLLPLRLFQLRLLETSRARLACLSHLLARSDDAKDWWLVPVGSRHLPLHTLVRPFRAVGKVGRRVLGGLPG
jgi:hypothetical protein